MGTSKPIRVIICLLLCSYFFTATDTATAENTLTTTDIAKIEKGMAVSKEIFKGLDDLAGWVTESKESTEIVQKVLKVFDGFGKLASSLGFIGSLISFIFAFIPKTDPVIAIMKEQFAEVNRKLDAMSTQISTLQKEMDWSSYASAYGKDANAIKNSWLKMQELLQKAPSATTAVQKSSLAEQFTRFYEDTATESSVANLYRYITDRSLVSVNKNVLQLVIDRSNGDFKHLTEYSSYFTGLMVSGLQMNVFYYKLRGYDAEAKAKESVAQLSDTLLAIQDALIGCANDFEKWARKDAEKLGTEKFSDNKQLAAKIQKHLQDKFVWYDWVVIAHAKDANKEYTNGESTSLVVQDKTAIHLIHRQKKATGEKTVVDYLKSTWSQYTSVANPNLLRGPVRLCREMGDEFFHIVGAQATSHIQFLHAVEYSSSYGQEGGSDIELKCPSHMIVPFSDIRINIFLKSKEVMQTQPCKKVNCRNGECKPIKDTTLGFCRCHKMYRGLACEESIQDQIDYAATEEKINDIIFHPVPDLSAIYYSVKELKEYTKELLESVHQDIQWTQTIVKYSEMIQKFRYIATFHTLLENDTIPQGQYISEIGAQFTAGGTFTFYLTQFNNMMTGGDITDRQNILDLFRTSLTQNSATPECGKPYTVRLDHFVRYLFALEKEAVLAWQKYLIGVRKSEEIPFIENLFTKFVRGQWKLFNGNGCGRLTADQLVNNYCDKAYHSTNQQQVRLKCLGNHTPYPQKVQCSKGQWSAIPVCYSAQVKGNVKCSSESGSTVCKTTCLRGWVTANNSQTKDYPCKKQPCPSITPEKCLKCSDNSVCQNHEVCEKNSGTCRDGCLGAPCGVNARCSSPNHQRTCTCVSPWKGDPYRGCKSQDLQWVRTSSRIHNAVVSPTGFAVCRAIHKGDWHGGHVSSRGGCNYEWGWGYHKANTYEALVDPCNGKGYRWVRGVQSNSVRYGSGWVCSVTKNGWPGKAFGTRHGYMCHIPKWKDERHLTFDTLVPKPCL